MGCVCDETQVVFTREMVWEDADNGRLEVTRVLETCVTCGNVKVALTNHDDAVSYLMHLLPLDGRKE